MEDAMSAAFRHLTLAEVKPGMVLSDVLLDRQGQVLLPKGTVLTVAMIGLLPRHGVEALAVLPSDEASLPSVDLDAIAARLDHVFRHTANEQNEDWASTMLQRHVTDYRLGREVEP
jgi:hypothetical protein